MKYFKLSVALAIVSFIGFLDAAYLTISHYKGTVPPCSIVVGCELVTTSKYSLILNIPVALLGTLYYLTILFLSLAYLDFGGERLILWVSRATTVGFLASLWFIFLQKFVINAWCLYCIGSAFSSVFLFFIGCIVLAKNRREKRERLKINAM